MSILEVRKPKLDFNWGQQNCYPRPHFSNLLHSFLSCTDYSSSDGTSPSITLTDRILLESALFQDPFASFPAPFPLTKIVLLKSSLLWYQFYSLKIITTEQIQSTHITLSFNLLSGRYQFFLSFLLSS